MVQWLQTESHQQHIGKGYFGEISTAHVTSVRNLTVFDQNLMQSPSFTHRSFSPTELCLFSDSCTLLFSLEKYEAIH
jgi:hypothetical protein